MRCAGRGAGAGRQGWSQAAPQPPPRMRADQHLHHAGCCGAGCPCRHAAQPYEALPCSSMLHVLLLWVEDSRAMWGTTRPAKLLQGVEQMLPPLSVCSAELAPAVPALSLGSVLQWPGSVCPGACCTLSPCAPQASARACSCTSQLMLQLTPARGICSSDNPPNHHSAACAGLVDLVRHHIYVGLADHTLAVLQHGTGLYLADMQRLSMDMFRQQVTPCVP